MAVTWCLTLLMTACSGRVDVIKKSSDGVGAPGRSWRVLQFNLCDSGIASCYSGRSVRAAATVIREWRPDVVTVNEVCRKDVSELGRALSAADQGMVLTAAFEPAVNRRNDGPFRCRNGQPYGIGVLAMPNTSGSGERRYDGRYPTQDLSDPEERVWLCIPADGIYACTTHTASTSTAVALAQCRYLTQTVVTTLRSRHGAVPVVVGADFNLPVGRSAGIQPCLEHRYGSAGDEGRQDVVASSGLTITSSAVIDMHGTTDHPALFVELARARTKIHAAGTA